MKNKPLTASLRSRLNPTRPQRIPSSGQDWLGASSSPHVCARGKGKFVFASLPFAQMQSLETSVGAGLNRSIEMCGFKSNHDGRAFMGRPLSLVSRLKQSSPWSVSTSPHFLFWNLQQACAYFTVFHSPHLYMKMILGIASDLHNVGFPDPPLLKVSELKLCDIHRRPRIAPHLAGPHRENAVPHSHGEGLCGSQS